MSQSNNTPEEPVCNKTVTRIRVYDYDGDLTKRWLVSYYEGKKRKLIGISSKLTTARERYAEAERIQAELLADPVNHQPDYVRLVQALDYAYDHKSDYLVNSPSLRSYRYVVTWLKEYLAKNNSSELALTQATPDFIDTFLRRHIMRGRKLSPASVNNYAAHLRALFTVVRKKYGHPNPLDDWQRLRVNETDVKIWPDKYIRVLSDYLRRHDHGMYLAVLLIFHSFIRPIELVRLQLGDFDTELGVVHVSARKGKSTHHKRPTLSKPARSIIAALKQQYPANYYLFGNGTQPGPTAHSDDYLTKRFKKIREHLNIPKVHKLYNFKHTGNSIFLAGGASIAELMHQNGHQEERTTRIYAKKLFVRPNERFSDNYPEF